MKKKIIVIIAILVVLIASFLVGTGFMKNPNVVLFDYSVAEDGTAISLGVQVPTSMGYIRGFKNNGGGVKPHYLTFYSTFGGLNSSFGTVNTFVLELEPDDTEIYFNRANGGYELVLQKNVDTGEWTRPSLVDCGQTMNDIIGNEPNISLNVANKDNYTDIVVGDEIAVLSDLIPMVMVNGELYLDTGHESTVEARCGVMDGEITSSVDGSEKTTIDNQSNFGTGYGYQYGSQEGLIEIYMNDKWWVFATEKVLASSQMMID